LLLGISPRFWSTTETTSDYEQVLDILNKETCLSVSIDYNYKFLVLLPLEADENIEALKHYYGITQQDELVVRGIEIRRHDIPNFIKQFQIELLYTLFNCKDSAEIVKAKVMKIVYYWLPRQ
jgi:DNA polymerase elongation subunit (family B)